MKNLAKSILIKSLWYGLGRKNVVRLGRFLSNQGRLDVGNAPATNGELATQMQVLKNHQSLEGLCAGKGKPRK